MEKAVVRGGRFFAIDADGLRTPLAADSLLVVLADGRELEIFLDEAPGQSPGIAVSAPNREETRPAKGYALLLRPAASNALRIAVEEYAVPPDGDGL